MKNNELAFFRVFYAANADLSEEVFEHSLRYRTALLAEIKMLDSAAVDALLKSRLQSLEPDAELLQIYEEIQRIQSSACGEPFSFDDEHDLVLATADCVKRITGKATVGTKDLPLLLCELRRALNEKSKLLILERHVSENAAHLNDVRIRELERKFQNASQSISVEAPKAITQFTHAQQAIAIHYLIDEALGVSNVDTSRLMELAHLLAAKSIPIDAKSGKENIRNSGIKSAFNRTWKKEDASHLKDLRFVLRFFKPLAVDGAHGIQKAVIQLEKRIARVSSKLNKTNA
jgi:hypothetical protein